MFLSPPALPLEDAAEEEVGTGGDPPNASAGTRIVIVLQSASTALFALTAGRSAIDVGSDLVGSVTVIVTSPAEDVGEGLASEVGRRVVADASTASVRLAMVGVAVGRVGRSLTAAVEGVAATSLTGAETEGVAGASLTAADTDASLTEAEIEGAAAALTASVGSAGAVGEALTAAATADVLGTSAPLEAPSMGGELKSLGTGGATGTPAEFVVTGAGVSATAVEASLSTGAAALGTMVALNGVGTPTPNGAAAAASCLLATPPSCDICCAIT